MKKYYEVHSIEDIFTGEPATVDTFDNLEESEKLYKEIAKTEPARLLLVDEEGMPLDELKSNY